MKDRSCPMSAKDVVNTYFMDNRARVVEIATFLDRVDRAGNPETGKADFRYRALIRALEILVKSGENRATDVQLSFSDLSAEPRESAMGLKGAYGAWEGGSDEDH